MNSDLKNIVLYHKNCPDGVTAAAIAYKKMGETALYFPYSYGDELPPEIVLCEHKKETDFYMLDICLDEKDLHYLKDEFKSLTILDHHISKKDTTLAFGGMFDNDKSGASLAWDYFFPNEPTPEFVKIIETIDIHRDGFLEIRDVESYINSLDYDLEIYSNLLENFDRKKDDYKTEGKAINRYVSLLEKMITKDFDIVLFEGVKMPAVNIDFDINTKSRILNTLYNIMPPVAMSYRWSNGKWKISLRSDNTFDVSKIATKYGGGGHKGAAGLVIDAPNGELFFKPLGKWGELQETL